MRGDTEFWKQIVVPVEEPLTYDEAMIRLLHSPDNEAIEFTTTVCVVPQPFVLHQRRSFRWQYSLYYSIPRIYDQVLEAVLCLPTTCAHAVFVVENRMVPAPSTSFPRPTLDLWNTFRCFLRCDFDDTRCCSPWGRYFPAWCHKTAHNVFEQHKILALTMRVRVFSPHTRRPCFQHRFLKDSRWFLPYPQDLVGGIRYTLSLMDAVDARFFDTEFHGIEHIRSLSSPSPLQLLVATAPRKHALHKLVFAEFPFERLSLVSTTGYPVAVHLTLIASS